MLFFQMTGRRYEHPATVGTSNKSFEERGEVIGDDVMAAALIDRLLHLLRPPRDGSTRAWNRRSAWVGHAPGSRRCGCDESISAIAAIAW